MDDAALSDGGDELTPEQHGEWPDICARDARWELNIAQMTFCLEQIRELIGDEAVSGLDDDFIKETLWDQYFNVESSLSYLYGA